MNDTIAAISTSTGRGAIGIIRMSGDNSIEVLKKIFISFSNDSNENFKLNYGKIVDNFRNQDLDEVLVSVMRSPRSYTKENMVEINCHGNSIILKKILDLLIRNGIRLAEAGEFTKRAFLNGRIDLTQAESIIDFIDSKSVENLNISFDNMNGNLKRKVLEFKEELINILSNINVVVDYPEEIENNLSNDTIDKVNDLAKKLKIIIESYETGKKIREGVKLSIVGKPNVGKSSILNKLLKVDRAIVTHIPGTTRDIIEETLMIKGLPIVILDTAGIRETDDLVEKIGIKLSKEAINESDLVAFVLDSSREISKEDIDIFNLVKDMNVIYILNKKDLERRIDLRSINLRKFIDISTEDNKDIELLEDLIYTEINHRSITPKSDELILNNIRHKCLFEKCFQHLDSFLRNSYSNPLDIVSIDLKSAIDSLAEIIGEITNEDILDNIFSKFCVGK